MRIVPPINARLSDEGAERARRSMEERITALVGLPFAQALIVQDVALKDGVATPVSHKLGRTPRFVRESCPRGAVSTGRIEEIRDGSQDRTRYVVLKATGWGATITVDLAVL